MSYPSQENKTYSDTSNCLSKQESPEGFIVQKCVDLHAQLSNIQDVVRNIESVMERLQGSIPVGNDCRKDPIADAGYEAGSINFRLINIQEMQEGLHNRLMFISTRLYNGL